MGGFSPPFTADVLPGPEAPEAAVVGSARPTAGVTATGGYLTVREVAEQLRVCTATVYAMVKAGKLPHRRVNNMIRIPAAALE